MKAFARLMVITLGLALVVFVSGLAGPQPRSASAKEDHDEAKNVVVTNTPNVKVVNTPTVNAQQSGVWNVGITSPLQLAPGTSVGINGIPTVNVASLPPIPPPALTTVVNIDDPGRVPYQFTANNVGKCSGSSCTFSFSTVPSGHRRVIQHIGGIINFSSAPSQIWVLIQTGGGGPLSGFFAPIPTGAEFTSFQQSALVYLDQSQSISIEVFLFGGSTFAGDSTEQFITLSGYELDCSMAPCAAIAQ